jgi:transposase-like protein
MIINDDFAFNIIKDWEKKDISPENKRDFLKSLLEEKDISQRELARILNISHSTLHDWISLRQKEKYYTKKNNEIDTLLDRLTFLLSKPFKVTSKTLERINRLKSELDKLELSLI